MRFRIGLGDALLAAACVSLVGLTGLNIVSYRRSEVLASERPVDDWKAIIQHGQLEGRDSAPFQIAVFSDYQCASCRNLYIHLRTLIGQYPDLFAVRWYHTPLPTHEHARFAAAAVTCAAYQGAFTALHESLFRDPAQLGSVPWNTLASSAGIRDTATFQECLQGNAADSVLALGDALAKRYRIVVTPAVVVDSQLYIGGSKALRRYLSERLRDIANAGPSPFPSRFVSHLSPTP